MSEWDNIGGAAISQTGPKFNAFHNYLVEVAAVKDQNSHHGNFFIVETVVHESDDPDLPPDTRPSWSANKKYPQTKGRILCFAGALFGIDPKNEPVLRSSINGSHIVALISPEHQMGKGRFVRITTGEKETNAGRDFVLHDFSPYTGPALPSRLANPTVAAGNSAQQAQQAAAPAPVTMPGAFVPPTMPSMPALPSFPQNGLPVPQGLMGLSTQPPAMPQVPSMGMPSPFAMPSVPSMGMPQVPSMPSIPQIPSIPQVQAPPVWPPAGWLQHPQSAAHFYKPGSAHPAKTESELRALQAAGQA